MEDSPNRPLEVALLATGAIDSLVRMCMIDIGSQSAGIHGDLILSMVENLQAEIHDMNARIIRGEMGREIDPR